MTQTGNLLWARAQSVLEPLCKATESILKPVPLFENDRLRIVLDETQRFFIVQAYGVKTTPDGNVECPASRYAAETWVHNVPERKAAGQGRWVLAATDFTALVIHHHWPRERLSFRDTETRNLYEFLLARFMSQSNAALLRANFKVNKIEAEMPADYIENPELPLADYQRVGVAACLEQEASALFCEQGTGKTAIAIARMCLEAQRFMAGKYGPKRMMRVLIVCPRQVRTNWRNEIFRFSVVPGKVTIIRGGEFRRIKLITDAIRSEPDCAFSAVIIGTDSVPRTMKALKMIPWDLCIVDESHYIKEHSTKRFKALKELRSNCKRRTVLTGTPIANSVMDLFSQLEFLGEGLSGFSSFENYKSFHGQYGQKGKRAEGNAVARLEAVKHIPLLQERLSRLAYLITKKEAGLKLPEKVYDVYEVEMTKSQAEYYRKIQTELAIEIEAMLNEETETKRVSADHVLTKLLRLAQITSGHVKFDSMFDLAGVKVREGHIEQIPGGNPKVQACLDMLQDPDRDPNGKTIIWAIFVEDIKTISAALTAAGIKHGTYYGATKDADREANVHAFNNDPEFKVLVCNPATAGEGLNLLGYNPAEADKLTTYCDHHIIFSQDWSATKRSQLEDRSHRRGTRVQLRITDLVVPGTIDEVIRERVTQKQQAAKLVQDLRAVLKQILNYQVDEDED